jgi:hypothetical protein
MEWCLARLLAPLAKSRILYAVLLLAFASHLASAQVPQPIETIMKSMLDATQASSLPDFVAAGDAAFQAGMTRPMLDSVSRQLGPRLRQGYTASFLSVLNQQGYTVYLWKLEFKDGKDDVLVTMAVRDGKVGGFWLS